MHDNLLRLIPSLFAYLRRLGVPESDALDMIQGFLTIFFERQKAVQLQRKPPIRDLRSWAFGVVRNLFKEHYKQNRREHQHPGPEPVEPVSAEAASASRHDLAQVHTYLLDHQDDQDLRAVFQHFFLDMTYADIAAVEQITCNTVRVRIHRGRNKLGDEFPDLA